MPQVLIKRSSVAGKVPTTTDLVSGELGMNTTDGKLYFKKTAAGVDTVVEITTQLANPTATITGTAVNGSATTFMRSDAAPALLLTIAQLNTAVTDADVAMSTAAQTFTGGQRGAVTVLTSSAAAIAINLATNNNFSHTTSENTTLSAPSNPVAGQSGVISITQGATARTLAYNTFWKFPGGAVPTLTATVGAVDEFSYYVQSGTRATAILLQDIK